MNDVNRITPNPNEIESIKKDAQRRFDLFWHQKNNEEMAKYVFENLYEALRELTECITLKEGVKIYSHEIAISYLKEQGHLSDEDFVLFDDMRKLRNKSKYYGKDISFARLKESIQDFQRLRKLLNAIIEDKK